MEVDPHIQNEQHAFIHQHSTSHQLLHLINHLIKNFNNLEKTATVFLDVEKVFDTVWYDGLLHKLLQSKTPMHLISLIKSFLSSRTFKVKTEYIFFSSKSVFAGVSQDSCHSPSLYLILTNDIPVRSGAYLDLFADNTLFHTSAKNPRRAVFILQKQINIASEWFKKWHLSINSDKTITIIFNRYKTSKLLKIKIHGWSLQWLFQAIYFGVILNNHLSFDRIY